MRGRMIDSSRPQMAAADPVHPLAPLATDRARSGRVAWHDAVAVHVEPGVRARRRTQALSPHECIAARRCHPTDKHRKETSMSAADKIRNAAEDIGGKAKEAVGKATDNDKLVAEGKADQLKASAKKMRDDAKDGLTG